MSSNVALISKCKEGNLITKSLSRSTQSWSNAVNCNRTSNLQKEEKEEDDESGSEVMYSFLSE